MLDTSPLLEHNAYWPSTFVKSIFTQFKERYKQRFGVRSSKLFQFKARLAGDETEEYVEIEYHLTHTHIGNAVGNSRGQLKTCDKGLIASVRTFRVKEHVP